MAKSTPWNVLKNKERCRHQNTWNTMENNSDRNKSILSLVKENPFTTAGQDQEPSPGRRWIWATVNNQEKTSPVCTEG